MNKKILAELLTHSQNDMSRITADYIKETFDVAIDRPCNSLEEYTNAIDSACMNKYFSTYWEADMKKWKYSGLQLIDEVNSLKPRAVLDVGCGYNEFKGKINNLTGIDPYNVHADWKVGALDYKTDKKYDVILCLGSINFGSRDKIMAEVAKCVTMLADGGQEEQGDLVEAQDREQGPPLAAVIAHERPGPQREQLRNEQAREAGVRPSAQPR